MHLTITAYSTAMFSTWFFVEEIGLLLDAGDGVTANLLQKSRKIRHVFISHADRDHLAGLLQFNQLNARNGFPKIYYPKDSGSFPALADFAVKFDQQVAGVRWHPIGADETIEIRKNLQVRTIRNGHVRTAGNLTKSLSFSIDQIRWKLREEFKNLSGPEIGDLVKQQGRASLSREERVNLLGYSGDSPVEDHERWDGTNILIHEATFLEDGVNSPHANKHSSLEAVLRMVSEIDVNMLILSHFSSRYSEEQIDEAIRKYGREYRIKIPVFRILPGRTHRDILNEGPVYE